MTIPPFLIINTPLVTLCSHILAIVIRLVYNIVPHYLRLSRRQLVLILITLYNLGITISQIVIDCFIPFANLFLH